MTSEQVDAFVQALHVAASNSTKPLVRSTLYTISATPEDAFEHSILSWKAQEYAYRQFSRDNAELPTLARGLFTEVVCENGKEHARIVARGYDKFFNMGELPWTSREAIGRYSQGPYTLSYKENGCIIFVAALSPVRLVITSKHAIGARPDAPVSHSDMGRTWLLRHLEQQNLNEVDLAAELWHRNETAVLELCDDSFEEHVLPYSAERTGLHLHGLNANTIDFKTRPMDEVNAFAEHWGFIPVRYKVFDTIEDVDAFAKKVAKTGSVDGEPVEGFVVRTTMPFTLDVEEGIVPPPYKPGQTWFYKIKFDEPYLMYRNWRELTRTMLRAKRIWEKDTCKSDSSQIESHIKQLQLGEEDLQTSTPEEVQTENKASAPAPQITEKESSESRGEAPSKKALKRDKKRAEREAQKAADAADAAARASGRAPPAPPTVRSPRAETHLYVQWCYDRLYGNASQHIAAQPELFEGFEQGRGIIALREKFLAYLTTPEGRAALSLAGKRYGGQVRDLRDDMREYTKMLLVPMAVVGSGKTALGVALTKLLNCAHVQSDDVCAKRTGPLFLKNIETALMKHDIVFADRNNHLLQHRDEIVDVVRRVSDPSKGRVGRVRLIALPWRLDGVPLSVVRHVCASRMVGRGDRHQCLRVENGPFPYDSILTRFISEHNPFQSATPDESGRGAGDEQFDDVIWLDIEASLEETLARVLDGLCPILHLPKPSTEQVAMALEAARSYSPAVRKPLPQLAPGPDPNAVYPTSYIGVFAHLNTIPFVEQLLDEQPGSELTASARHVLTRIHTSDRVTREPHVTLVHQNDVKNGFHTLWDALYKPATSEPAARPAFAVHVSALAWNDRVMALRVDNMHTDSLPEEVQSRILHLRKLHITIGVASENAKAYEGGKLFEGSATGLIHVQPRTVSGVLGFCSNCKRKP